MKHLPNLLKQESSCAATLVTIYLRMYNDPRADSAPLRQAVADRMLPCVTAKHRRAPLSICSLSLAQGVIEDFNKLRPDSQSKNISTWSPVVAELLRGFNDFDDQTVSRLAECMRSD